LSHDAHGAVVQAEGGNLDEGFEGERFVAGLQSGAGRLESGNPIVGLGSAGGGFIPSMLTDPVFGRVSPLMGSKIALPGTSGLETMLPLSPPFKTRFCAPSVMIESSVMEASNCQWATGEAWRPTVMVSREKNIREGGGFIGCIYLLSLGSESSKWVYLGPYIGVFPHF
jgi:hypothetical protein